MGIWDCYVKPEISTRREKMRMAQTWQISILEGVNSDDVSTYYCHEEPLLVAKTAETKDGDKIESLFMSYVPRNGYPSKINRVNFVPLARVVGIVEPEEQDFEIGS